MKYAYYPGCAGESTAKEYDDSVKEVCQILGIELEELEDWNCCGASSGHSTSYLMSHALAGRNLAIAEKAGLDTVAPCPACFLRLKATRHEVLKNDSLQKELEKVLGTKYTAAYDARNILDIIYNDVGLEKVREKVVKPLKGLKLVCYYGCYLVRPPEVVCFDEPENPRSMDELLITLGAEIPDWSAKVDCCGGSFSLSRKDIVIKLVSDITGAAREVGADGIVTACGLCETNLDTRQGSDPLPIFYFTELMGLAMGSTKAKSWFKKHITSPLKLLGSYGLI